MGAVHHMSQPCVQPRKILTIVVCTISSYVHVPLNLKYPPSPSRSVKPVSVNNGYKMPSW